MIAAAVIIGSLFVYWAVAYFTSRRANTTLEEFAVGSRDLSAFLIAAGLSMTFVGGAATVNMAALGYRYGFAALVDPAAVFIGLCAAALLIRRYRSDQFVTITQSLAQSDGLLYGVISVVSVAFYLLLMAANIVAFTRLAEPFVGVPAWLISAAGTILVASYTLRSGIISVTKTDVVQLAAVIIMFVVPCLYMVAISSTPLSTSATLAAMPLNTFIILSFTLFLCPVLQDVKLRAQAARSEADARNGILTAAALYVIIVVTAVATGRAIALAGIEVSTPENVLAVAFETYLGPLSVVLVVGILAAILSTLDGFALAAITLAQAATRPLAPRRATAFSVGILLFSFALAIAVIFPQVLVLILLALLLYVSVLLPLAAGRLIGVGDRQLAIGTIIFLSASVVLYLSGWEPLPYAVMFPLLHLIIVLCSYVLLDGERKHDDAPATKA